MAGIERWLDRLILAAIIIAGCGLALMMVHIVADVTWRYLFNRPLVDTVETVSYYYMIAVVFLPLAYVERRSEHIEVELFVQHLPVSIRNVLYLLGRLTAIAFFGILTYQTWLDALDYMRIREVPMGSSLEIWPSRFILPLSFTLLIAALLLHAVRAVLHLRRAKPQGDGPAFAREEHAYE